MAIIVTRGSSGIGRAIAERFADSGVDVFINYHSDDDAAAEAAASVESRGATVHLLKGYVGTPEGVAAVIAGVRDWVERLTQLVHRAAKTHWGPPLDADPSELFAAVNVNGLALVSLVREALPILAEGSTVFLLSSRGARFVIPNYGALGTAKALAEHIVRYLAAEAAARRIRVNTVSSVPVETSAFPAMFPLTSASGSTTPRPRTRWDAA